MKLGSLFSGYGGLDQAVHAAFGDVETAWVSDFDTGPNKILAHRYPSVPNLGDITTIDWTQVEPVDIIAGGFPCFAAGTPVLTRRGLIGIEDVREGDEVWTHKSRWRAVTATMSRDAQTVEFRPGFYSTPEHRLWLRDASPVWRNEIRRYQRVLSEPRWIKAQDMQGRFAATPIAVTSDAHTKPARLSWWQIGRWLADGFVNGGGVNVYIGHAKRDDVALLNGWTVQEQQTALRVRLPGSTPEGKWLTEHFGAGAYGKTLPAFAFALPEGDREELIRGYWSGDGYRFSETAIRSASVSPNLTIGIQMLAASLGRTTSIHFNRTSDTTVIEGRSVAQRDWWSVTATEDDGRYAERDAEWLWQKLRRSPSPAGVRTVYDLTVADDHSFVAAGIVVHNCQDVSLAGRRAGMTEGTRSNLWGAMRTAIETIRPRYVVAENVRGLLSARATSDSDMESGGGPLGDGGADNLRALGRVLGDLADLGYDAAWCGLRAADVGAPHGRFRVFIVAEDSLRSGSGGWTSVARDSASERADPGSDSPRVREVALLPTPVAQPSGNSPEDHLRKKPGRTRVTDLSIMVENGLLATGGQLLPTPTASEGNGIGAHGTGGADLRTTIATTDFGVYAPAIERWEHVLGRSAPSPTEPGTTRPRLSARFVEWMMGLPEGWVTDTPGITRNQQLKALGNGVVPLQCEAALRHLLDLMEGQDQ